MSYVDKEKVGHNLYRWLIKNNFPVGFQVLCHNHNAEKQYYKIMTLAEY